MRLFQIISFTLVCVYSYSQAETYNPTFNSVPSRMLASPLWQANMVTKYDSIRVKVFPHNSKYNAPHGRDNVTARFQIKSAGKCTVYKALTEKSDSGGFDIAAASEVMAILALAQSWEDLTRRGGAIVVGRTRSGEPVRATDLKAAGAMAALLRDALQPNLVQTLEHTPALVHAGPFANIAHGCSSVVATRAALRLPEYVVTEAGFGADLGAEKFVDIKCRQSGRRPDAAVVVATLSALKHHGGAEKLGAPDCAALERGMGNLLRHVGIVRDVLGLPCLVCLNRFAGDADRELDRARRLLAGRGENGTAIGDAIALAAARLKNAEGTRARQSQRSREIYQIKSKVMILLTDGQNNSGKRDPVQAARLAAQWGIKINTVGVGGRETVPAAAPPFGIFPQMPAGQPVDERALKAIAEATGGVCRMAEDAEALQSIYREIDRLERSEIQVMRYRDYKELFTPLALAALLLVSVETVLNGTVFRKIP